MARNSQIKLSGNKAMVPRYKYEAVKAVLADREKELLALKGPCSSLGCPLHYAHSGPCNIQKATDNAS